MRLDLKRVQQNVAKSETLDLLDRVTAYRQGMEPEAIILIEEELHRRGVSAQDIRAHAEHVEHGAIWLEDGTAARCSFCDRPAVARTWGWHRLYGILPVFPRIFRYCAEHRPVMSI